MDVGSVATVGDAAVLAGTYVAAAAGGGLVGNGAYDGLRAVVGWFQRRGVEPDARWADGPLQEAEVAGMGEIDAGSMSERVWLIAQVRVEVDSIGGKHAHVYSDNSRVTQIMTVEVPLKNN